MVPRGFAETSKGGGNPGRARALLGCSAWFTIGSVLALVGASGCSAAIPSATHADPLAEQIPQDAVDRGIVPFIDPDAKRLGFMTELFLRVSWTFGDELSSCLGLNQCDEQTAWPGRHSPRLKPGPAWR